MKVFRNIFVDTSLPTGTRFKIYGDSITKGEVVVSSFFYSWSQQLGRMLGIAVDTNAANGETLQKLTGDNSLINVLFEPSVTQQALQPITPFDSNVYHKWGIFLGVNDADLDDPVYNTPATFRAALIRILDEFNRLNCPDSKIFIVNIGLRIGASENTQENIDLFNGVYEDVCDERNIILIDINTPLRALSNPFDYFPDGLHPNDLGCELIAGIVADRLQDIDPPIGNIINVGTGSGALSITQANTGAVNGDTIVILPGNYSSIQIKDFNMPSSERVTIKNGDGLVGLQGELSLDNIKGITLAGTGANDIINGIKIHDVTGRAVKIYNYWSDVTLSNIEFADVTQEVIATEADVSNIEYIGTDATLFKNIIITLCSFDNVQLIAFGGGLNGETQDKGLYKDFEIYYCTFSNMGNALYLANVWGYKIHHNVFTNINLNYETPSLPNGPHNGIITICGNGDCYNNKITNFQGNMIRSWINSRGGTPVYSSIYNNIAYDSWKYSMGEFQTFSFIIVAGKTTFGNARCYGNTVEGMNRSGDWHGVVIDVYNLQGGTFEVFNNLSIDNPTKTDAGGIVNNQGQEVYPTNNLYFDNRTLAKVDSNYNPLVTSAVIGAGLYNSLTSSDYNDKVRVNPPAIGAVEYTP